MADGPTLRPKSMGRQRLPCPAPKWKKSVVADGKMALAAQYKDRYAVSAPRSTWSYRVRLWPMLNTKLQGAFEYTTCINIKKLQHYMTKLNCLNARSCCHSFTLLCGLFAEMT